MPHQPFSISQQAPARGRGWGTASPVSPHTASCRPSLERPWHPVPAHVHSLRPRTTALPAQAPPWVPHGRRANRHCPPRTPPPRPARHPPQRTVAYNTSLPAPFPHLNHVLSPTARPTAAQHRPSPPPPPHHLPDSLHSFFPFPSPAPLCSQGPSVSPPPPPPPRHGHGSPPHPFPLGGSGRCGADSGSCGRHPRRRLLLHPPQPGSGRSGLCLGGL